MVRSRYKEVAPRVKPPKLERADVPVWSNCAPLARVTVLEPGPTILYPPVEKSPLPIVKLPVTLVADMAAPSVTPLACVLLKLRSL